MIDEYLIRLENHLKEIKNLLQSIAGNAPTTTTLASLGVEAPKIDYLNEFNELKKLVESKDWPIAVDPDLICNEANIDDKKVRAEGIIDFMISEPLQGKKFLEFGCGDGLCVREAVKKGAELAVGYDLNKTWLEDSSIYDVGGHKAELTTDWSVVKNFGQFDVIFVYDVLDHAVGTQEEILKKIKSVSKPDARIYLRCHPWCSRSATHSYRTLNKAYTHLVFSDIELVRLGIPSTEPSHKIIHPHLSYKTWFADAGLEVLEEHPYIEEVEEFFEMTPLVANRIKRNWSGSHEESLAKGTSFPSYQLRLQFIDYVLKVS